MKKEYRILLLGDFHFGESYSRAGSRVLEKNGYEYSLKHLRPFVEKSDTFIINLETPIVDPNKHPSPLENEKTYIHWAAPAHTPQALKALGVDAVSLANNHTLDHGVEGLTSSFENLAKVGIAWFGAGEDLDGARKPHVVSLPAHMGGGEVHIHGSFEYSKVHDEKFGFYAKQGTPGCAPLSLDALMETYPVPDGDEAFHIAFPHWGANYKWRRLSQRRLGDKLLEHGYDLVLGHGSHCLQQLERRKRRWVAYSIGNGNFQSGGRFQRYVEDNGILPMGAWAMFHVELSEEGERRTHVRLYPVYSDNQETGFQPGPVSEEDFWRVIDQMGRNTSVKDRFDNGARDFGRDELGWYIRAELGVWSVGGKPRGVGENTSEQVLRKSPSVASLGGGAARIYTDPDSVYIREQQTVRGKNVAPLLISREAEKKAGSTEWIDSRIALVQYGDRRILLQGHRGGESAVGKALIGDKYLTKRLLLAKGVSTPRGDLASTPEDAINAQKRYNAPVVVKPRFGLKGRGVSVNLTSSSEITDAFHRADSVGGVVVEEYIEVVEEYRCLTTPNECVSVVRRILPNVTGDGCSTVLELIHRKNEQRQFNPSTYGRPTPVDAVTEAYLKRSGLSYEYVPRAGENLTVRDVGGLSSGGEPYEYSDVVSDEVKQTATEAAQAIPGLSWGGADVVISRETGHPYVIEINSDADISGATFPFYGEPVNVAARMWQMRLDAAKPDSKGEVEQPKLRNNPLRLKELAPWVATDRDRLRLSEILLAVLAGSGYEIHHEGPTIARAVDQEGREHWFRDCSTVDDLAVVSEAVRRHGVVRRLLRSADVSRPLARRARTRAEVQKLMREQGEPVALLPYQGEWGGSQSRYFRDEAELEDSTFSDSRSWLIQSCPQGREFHVLSTPEGGLAVLGHSSANGGATIQAAVHIATQSVRAVPGLRWAFVHVVVRENGRALVEGMSMNPVLWLDWYVVAGDIDESLYSLVAPWTKKEALDSKRECNPEVP